MDMDMCVCARACVFLHVCVCVCKFVWQTNKNVVLEIRLVISCCRNIFVSSTFIPTSKTFIERTFKLATV